MEVEITKRTGETCTFILGRCDCIGNTLDEEIGSWEDCPLEGGGHTSFILLKCRFCGRLSGFPGTNLDIAIERGTAETRAKLLEIFKQHQK